MVLTHVRVGCDDPEQAFKFYDATFGALGVPAQRMGENAMYGEPGKGMLVVGTPRDGEPATHANGGTIGLGAASPAHVGAWHAAGLANGGTDEGAPGRRDYGTRAMYGAYLRDPTGNKLCAFCQLPE
jgi:catechol 2,3-dioxygenase-like lactoylglutathione lyase family enzyme